MKTIISTLVLILLGLFTSAQSKYELEMQKTFTEWDSIKSGEDYVKVQQHFDRIAKVEKTQLLPSYYLFNC